MSATPTPPPTPGHHEPDDPLTGFSQCHAGIMAHLEALEELPALVEPARRARRIASETVDFFRRAVYEHHQEEERELFPAVLLAAERGAEREGVQVIVDRLTAEHRQIEAMWSRLEPQLKALAKGQDVDFDASAVQRLIESYVGHARYEESEFLPLSHTLLGRNGNHMAALGVALHMRHVMPDILKNFRHRI